MPSPGALKRLRVDALLEIDWTVMNVESNEQLVSELSAAAESAGLTMTVTAPGHIEGEIESIRAKWFLGKRTVRYRMGCDLDPESHTVTFRESLLEKVIGMAPPTFSVQKTTQKGTRVVSERKDKSIGGGGTVSYGNLREEFERIVTAAGWRFEFQPGRVP